MKPAPGKCLTPEVRKDINHELIRVKAVFNEFYECQKKKAKDLGMDVRSLKIPDTTKQQKGLAAALASMSHPDVKDLIAEEMEVTVATINKYLAQSVSPRHYFFSTLMRLRFP